MFTSMPCYDGREDRDNLHADEAVRLLCAVCRKMDKKPGVPLDMSDVLGLKAWWHDHKEIDREDNAYRFSLPSQREITALSLGIGRLRKRSKRKRK